MENDEEEYVESFVFVAIFFQGWERKEGWRETGKR